MPIIGAATAASLQSLTLVPNSAASGIPAYQVANSDQGATGLDLDLQWKINRVWRLSGSLEYIDQTYDKYVSPTGVNISGQAAGPPYLSAALGAAAKWPALGGNADFSLQYGYSGKRRCNDDTHKQGLCRPDGAVGAGKTQEGSDPALQPVLLTAHMDVVPVEPGTEDKWRHAPFAGVIADGYVWGRGTLDMKHAVMATFEGVEHLLAAGFRPKRTILLAFGHDEELGGHHGASRIADLLEQRKGRARFSLDEGSLIVDGLVPGMGRPVAPVGLSEKGYMSLQLTATATGLPLPAGAHDAFRHRPHPRHGRTHCDRQLRRADRLLPGFDAPQRGIAGRRLAVAAL